MALRYLLDENLRGGALWPAIQRHNARGAFVVDVVQVGDPPDLPLGTADPDLLLWAERNSRILVSQDKTTLPGHLAQHLAAGHHVPGIFLLRAGSTVSQVLPWLILIAHAGDPLAYLDRIEYIP
jgi:hypothetical protein